MGSKLTELKAKLRLAASPRARAAVGVAVALVTAAALKLAILSRVPFNADEAVVALMARHILQGARPVFFYGQAYMGSLDAYLVAGAFRLFGEQIWAIRFIQAGLYLMVMTTTYVLGRKWGLSSRAAVLAVWLLAVPTVNVTLYTTASLGGYGEMLLFGNLILILTLWMAGRLEARQLPGSAAWLLWGFLAGAGIWAFGLTLVFSLPAGLFLAWKLVIQGKARGLEIFRAGLAAAAGLLLGAAPWWLYGIQHGFAALLGELGGGAIAGVEAGGWAQQVALHAFNLVVLGGSAALGLRPPWAVRWLALPLIPFILVFWGAAAWFALRRWRANPAARSRYALLAGVALTLCAGFLISPFGADPSGRYFLPLAVPMAILGAAAICRWQANRGPAIWGLALLLPVFHLWGVLQCAAAFPPGITTQFDAVTQIDHRQDAALIRFLREKGETRGYTNYWVAYPLAFQSREELLFAPRLPYHPDLRYTRRDDRYPPYSEQVDQAEKVAYITTNNPALDELLTEEFIAAGITWEEAQIGDYHVFYNLSSHVAPKSIGLDVERKQLKQSFL